MALRIARDLIVELRIKLKSIGVPLKGPMDVYCDNQGVVKDTSVPESTLNKKLNSSTTMLYAKRRQPESYTL